MNILPPTTEESLTEPAQSFSAAGRERLLSVTGEPLLLADWERTLFIHYEVDTTALQRELPFELDLWNGKAYVSLVAFMMRDMHPRIGGRLAAWVFKPVATHGFLNVRAYVKHDGETGICFLAEWLSNRLSVALGPPLYGLPYRYAKLDYRHEHESGCLKGAVKSSGQGGQLAYAATMAPGACFYPSLNGSLTEFLLERYTAFNWRGSSRRLFRVWHSPWRQTSTRVLIMDDSLLTRTWPWFADAKLVGANYSPGLRGVWMGRAHTMR